VQIFRRRIIGRRIFLGKNGNDGGRKVVHVFDERDGLLAPNVERGHVTREENGIADRQNRKLVAELNGVLVGGGGARRWVSLFLGHAVVSSNVRGLLLPIHAQLGCR
jgi:hypothetical protein